jgi:hypothetical protein
MLEDERNETQNMRKLGPLSRFSHAILPFPHTVSAAFSIVMALHLLRFRAKGEWPEINGNNAERHIPVTEAGASLWLPSSRPIVLQACDVFCHAIIECGRSQPLTL